MELKALVDKVAKQLCTKSTFMTDMTGIDDELVQDVNLFPSLISFHHQSFVELYLQRKEKYLRFQIDWHNHCSMFLEKASTVDCIIPSLSEKLHEVRALWLSFCEKHSQDNYKFASTL
jgi:hypothetical protein